jgi:hypothetical protein
LKKGIRRLCALFREAIPIAIGTKLKIISGQVKFVILDFLYLAKITLRNSACTPGNFALKKAIRRLRALFREAIPIAIGTKLKIITRQVKFLIFDFLYTGKNNFA